MNSTNYDEVVLFAVQEFFQEHAEEGYIFMQDNAPSYRLRETKINLALRQIPCVKFPLYSLNLNLIEHV